MGKSSPFTDTEEKGFYCVWEKCLIKQRIKIKYTSQMCPHTFGSYVFDF